MFPLANKRRLLYLRKTVNGILKTKRENTESSSYLLPWYVKVLVAVLINTQYTKERKTNIIKFRRKKSKWNIQQQKIWTLGDNAKSKRKLLYLGKK